MTYLARCRMLTAADRLKRGETISRISRDLGYSSESAIGAAFRRIMAVSPRRYACG